MGSGTGVCEGRERHELLRYNSYLPVPMLRTGNNITVGVNQTKSAGDVPNPKKARTTLKGFIFHRCYN